MFFVENKTRKNGSGRGWLHHLKFGRTSCSGATEKLNKNKNKLKDAIERRARDEPDEPYYVENG